MVKKRKRPSNQRNEERTLSESGWVQAHFDALPARHGSTSTGAMTSATGAGVGPFATQMLEHQSFVHDSPCPSVGAL